MTTTSEELQRVTRRLTLSRTAVALLGAQAVATLWALVFRLPYAVGGHGSEDRVAYDLWTRGTAISAPLVFLGAYSLVLVAAHRPGRVGLVSTAALALLTVVAVVAGAMEPAVGTALHGGYSPIVATGVLVLAGASIAAAILVLAAARTHVTFHELRAGEKR